MKKKSIARLLVLALLFGMLSGVFILAEENPEDVAGVYTFVSENADMIKIGENKYYPVSADNIVNKITFKVSGCDSNKNKVYLNGTELGSLTNGECTFEFKNSAMLEGKNEVRVMLSDGSSTFSGGVVYGSYNLDDIVIESVSITYGVQNPIAPTTVIKYMPIEGSAEIKSVEASYVPSQSVGDGWNSETKLGGTTPNVPVYIGYILNKPSDSIKYFSIDTTKLNDGEYKVQLYKNDELTGSHTIRIDNTAPEITFSFKNGETIANSNTISFNATDKLNVTITAEVDGKAVKGTSVSLKSFKEGAHTLYVTATDALGNKSVKLAQFTVKQTIPDYTLEKKNGSAVLTIPEGASAQIYSVELVGRINMYYNRLGEFFMKDLRSSDEVLTAFSEKANIVTESVGNTLPYQAFVIDVSGKSGDAIVSYKGETGNGEDILIQGWNYQNSCWDTLARTDSGVSVSFKVSIDTYSKDGKMRIKASPYVYSNGSDTLLWVSDTQYYSRYDDLKHVYTDIMNYAKNEYIAGNIGYVVHTGDLVDQTNVGDAVANAQYKVASDAQSILDKANVPNGIVTGNHDIKHTEADYSYFKKYFGADRYKNFEWYGGNQDDNTNHFDLITLGRYDFLFLYLGCYKEAEQSTIDWANAVLQAYPERNAVICTHEYILPSGAYSGDRAKVIWDKIVVPNENVKMILCGHNDGAANQLHQVEGSDRYVLEILADYQFAELGAAPNHVENGMTCDGEGFIRLMTFNDAGQVITTTYSPTADQYNYYPSYVDSFVYDLDLKPAVRSIKTTDFSVGVNIRDEGEFGKDEISLSGADGVFAVITQGEIQHTTEILELKNKSVSYPVFADPHDYDAEFERYVVTGMSGVAPSLRREENNAVPSSELVQVGLNLMPSKTQTTTHASGSKDYIPTYMEDGKYALKFTASGSSTWCNTSLALNKSFNIDEYDRLYFGVTAEPNTKWNLIIYFGNGTILNFSQGLYEFFGYEKYYIPSDIQGTWQGYIPLKKLKDSIKGEVTVVSVSFVAATSESPVVFDYFFIGKSLGESVNFVIDDKTEYSVDYLEGSEVAAIAAPVKNGYIFEGWFTDKENGEKIEFPVKVKKGGLTVYARFTKKDAAAGATYYNDEVEILPGTDYKAIVLWGVIGLTILSGVAAAVISSARRRKKNKA